MKTQKGKIIIFVLIMTMAIPFLGGCAKKVKSNDDLDLSSMALEDIIAKAKEEGEVHSVGMPDTWANWGGTWADLEEKYGITHSDVDVSSAEELAIFENEKSSPTKDIGDVGISFGPVAKEKGLTLPYKTSYWDEIPDWAKDDEGHWMVGYTGTIVFLSNKKYVANPPKSWEDLLAGDYKISIGDVSRGTRSQLGVLAAALAYGGSEEDIMPGINFFKQIAEQGRLDLGEDNTTRLEKGEIQCSITYDFNASEFSDIIDTFEFEIHVPKEATVSSGYASIINRYAPHPHAAALAREYIFSDEGQINLAQGYARPIRTSVELPEDVKEKLVPEEEYVNVYTIKDYDAWEKTASEIGVLWQEHVLSNAK